MKHPGVVEPECLLQKMPCVICPSISRFWKYAGVAIVVLMFIFAMTLWGMALALSRYGTDLKEGKVEVLGAIGKVGNEVKEHKQMTMENRTVQSRIEGMLQEHRWTEEQRRGK